MTITFALPTGFDYDANKFAKQVKTKKWAATHKNNLVKYADKFTNANSDSAWIIGGMLQTAYGVNIGKQVEGKLTEKDFVKIRANILSVVYDGNW